MISIITPHYNNSDGIKNILTCLDEQTSNDWEWIIVDDMSVNTEKQIIKDLLCERSIKQKIILINATKKLYGGGCRNLGALKATSEILVFLDSDDLITKNFVKHRNVNFKEDFLVYNNFYLQNVQTSKTKRFSNIERDYLKNFLKARFPWQTTAILWNKNFFTELGGFTEKLERLQDVDISIRALLSSNQYRVLNDNEVDFYYQVDNIDISKRSFIKISNSVKILINNLINKDKYFSLSNKKKLINYYYLNVRYFVKSSNLNYLEILRNDLIFFRSSNIINYLEYILGLTFITFLKYRWIDFNLFLKLNRKVYKQLS